MLSGGRNAPSLDRDVAPQGRLNGTMGMPVELHLRHSEIDDIWSMCGFYLRIQRHMNELDLISQIAQQVFDRFPIRIFLCSKRAAKAGSLNPEFY